MEYDYKILEQKFNSLPPEIQAALTSVEVSEEMKKIANKHGLLLDQASILFDTTSHVILGLIPGKDFVKILSRDAKISSDLAQKVAVDINRDVLGKIKLAIQISQEQESVAEEPEVIDDSLANQSTISNIEQAGGFSVDREVDNENITDSVPISRDAVLEGIENPSGHTADPPANLPTEQGGISVSRDTDHFEPMVDYLLQNTMGQAEHKTVVEQKPSIPVSPKKPVVQQQPRSGPDPYREEPK